MHRRLRFLLCLVVLALGSCAPATLLPQSGARDVAPGCPAPSVDTTRWQRVHSELAPVSFLLPSPWKRSGCRTPGPTVEVWCGPRAGDELAVQVGHASSGPPSANETSPHPTLYFSRCTEMIGGQTVWIAAGIQTGYTHLAEAWSEWRLPDGRSVHISVTGARRRDHEMGLMILRTVRLTDS